MPSKFQPLRFCCKNIKVGIGLKTHFDITSDQPILSRPKMAPQLKLPGTQAKCTEGPFWTQLEYTEGPFWTKLECTEGPFWLSKAV